MKAAEGASPASPAAGEMDPNLALAGLRIETEKRVRRLAALAGVEAGQDGVAQLLRALAGRGVLTAGQQGVLADMLELLSSAVHGAAVDRRAAEWAMDVGMRVLRALDGKIEGLARG